MRSALFPISPRTPPATTQLLSRSPPPLSPFSRSPTGFPSLNIPTKRVQSIKPTEKERITTELLSCGANDVAQLGQSTQESDTCNPDHVVSNSKSIRNVACGLDHTLSLSSSGQIYTWGSNEEGQLGIPEYDYSLNQATLV